MKCSADKHRSGRIWNVNSLLIVTNLRAAMARPVSYVRSSAIMSRFRTCKQVDFPCKQRETHLPAVLLPSRFHFWTPPPHLLFARWLISCKRKSQKQIKIIRLGESDGGVRLGHPQRKEMHSIKLTCHHRNVEVMSGIYCPQIAWQSLPKRSAPCMFRHHHGHH